MTKPTKREIKFAQDNPFVCPHCTDRFPDRTKRDQHWRERPDCKKYAEQGIIAVQTYARGYQRAIEIWEDSNELKKTARQI